jgi:hypothetical protein
LYVRPGFARDDIHHTNRPDPSPFSVTWNNILFSDFTLPANAQPTDQFTWEAIYNQANGYGRGDFTI